jgi:hypothetical protein
MKTSAVRLGIVAALVAALGAEAFAQGANDSPASGPRLNGFSVVLVEGDLRAGAQDPLPPAAAKALADLKDFLPYRSFRLLDTSWTLAAPQSRLGPGGPANTLKSRLRGAAGQDYELVLVAEQAPGPTPRTPSREVNVLKFQLGASALSSLGLAPPNAFPPITAAPGSNFQNAPPAQVFGAPGPLIDTSFRMDVGETVVVGTSRLNGDKALIALLTAVGR